MGSEIQPSMGMALSERMLEFPAFLLHLSHSISRLESELLADSPS